ncbi:metal-binding protein [Emticicia sp. CRIBPO]|uniref:Ada metal-binding domain-containing protein n=1 Tax=Emticicia sp. CRIBPO TaxID=2683258 RepID=UPI001411D55F|nr:Ada metal-binding domain-containing protein [Emticicia sp. CRIBPO]NBA88686.1 metal-binding protein [Emticicia sp. CRIBPO]
MWYHEHISDSELRHRLRNKTIVLGGNKQLKIYGRLKCKSGKRMKRTNRVFFSSVHEAESLQYRPCGHCMPKEYQLWKQDATKPV